MHVNMAWGEELCSCRLETARGPLQCVSCEGPLDHAQCKPQLLKKAASEVNALCDGAMLHQRVQGLGLDGFGGPFRHVRPLPCTAQQHHRPLQQPVRTAKTQDDIPSISTDIRLARAPTAEPATEQPSTSAPLGPGLVKSGHTWPRKSSLYILRTGMCTNVSTQSISFMVERIDTVVCAQMGRAAPEN